MKNAGDPLNVLVVDDETEILELLVFFLEEEQFVVTPFSDPLLALGAFEGDEKKFDLLVTDFSMPKLKGTELISKLKNKRPDMKAILFSGFTDSIGEDQRKIIDLVVPKPEGLEQIGKSARRLF